MSQSKPMRPLLMLHLLGVAALASGAGYWIWSNTPARQAYAFFSKHRSPSDPLGMEPLFKAAKAVTGDVLFAFIAIVLFTIGTRVYVKQLQNWLDARGAGEAAQFGSQRLEDRAIAANKRAGVSR